MKDVDILNLAISRIIKTSKATERTNIEREETKMILAKRLTLTSISVMLITTCMLVIVLFLHGWKIDGFMLELEYVHTLVYINTVGAAGGALTAVTKLLKK